jgi:probable HAF family extracellular repeat protein/uncharacterized repeat protein (TIGR03803 family)
MYKPVALMCLVCCVLDMSTSARASLYESFQVTDLGSLGGNVSAAFAINDSGQVVGWSYTASNAKHAFLWAPTGGGTMTDLGVLPGGAESGAYGINASGQIAGYSYTSNNGPNGFLYSSGTMTDIGTQGGNGNLSTAYAVDASGTVAGEAQNISQDFRAVTFAGSTLTSLGELTGGSYSEAHGINSSGVVVGKADTATGDTHAVMSSGESLTDLGVLTGGTYSDAFAINDSNTAVGEAQTSAGAIHACQWSGGAVTDFGALTSSTFSYSSADAINASGAAVGDSYTGTAFHACLFSGGTITDLNSEISSGSGWVLEAATGINDLGQIVGYGLLNGQEHGFVLSQPDGYGPEAPLLYASDGNFYGTTSQGGLYGFGTLFRMNTLGNVTTLHSFNTLNSADAGSPATAGVIQVGNSLYGTTRYGGSNGAGDGAVFGWNMVNSAFSVVHSFGATSTDGTEPLGGVVLGNDGNLYGTTSDGGQYGDGTLFDISPTGSGYTVLYSFAHGMVTFNDGANPMAAPVVAANGNLYGPTSVDEGYEFIPGTGVTQGPSESNSSYAYTIDSSGNFIGSSFDSIFKINSAFTTITGIAAPGGEPTGPAIQLSDGFYYGAAATNAETGFIFKAASGSSTTIHSFNASTEGTDSQGGLIQENGDLYGTAQLGGLTAFDSQGAGSIFKTDTSGNLTVLHLFNPQP